MKRPVIGITCDTAPPRGDVRRRRYESPFEYAACVSGAGGVPLLLPYEVDRVGDYIELCDGFILSGGDDPDTRAFGEPVHPAAKLVDPQRQAFETALLRVLDATAHPVLGVCLGMQMMALHAGGRLHQHLPDAPGFAAEHAAIHREGRHAIQLLVNDYAHLRRGGDVHSHHHQSVADPGKMRLVAISDEQSAGRVIEAIDLSTNASVASGVARFYLGVQWHPEQTVDDDLGPGLIARFVAACATGG